MPTKSGTLTRVLAIDALNHVLTRNMHADSALDKLFESHADELKALDRAFVFEMVYGSLRWLSKMDWIIKHMLDRPFASLDIRVINAIRIGTYQIFYMDRVPDRAAVSETVEALKNMGMRKASSFVNAVLRRVSKRAEYFPKPDKVKERADYLAMHHAHPKWMVERWLEAIPLPRLEFLLDSNNIQPKHILKELKSNPIPTGETFGTYLLREHGIESKTRPLPGCWEVSKLPNFASCPAFLAGCYIVQEEAAQVVASLVCPSSSDSVLDACSAPGGKSIYLRDGGLPASQLVLLDQSQKRLSLLRENLSRCRMEGSQILQSDATDVLKTLLPSKKFNKIMLDAPCSAMGVIRKHPEIKWLRHLTDVKRCATEQRLLINSLATLVEKNGELIYIVCSFEKEETTEQIQNFLTEHENFRLASLAGRLHDYYRKYVTDEGYFLSLPGNSDNLEGFFAVVLERFK